MGACLVKARGEDGREQGDPPPGGGVEEPPRGASGATSCDKAETPGEGSAPGKTQGSAFPVRVVCDQLGVAGRLADRRHPAGLAAAAGPRRRPGLRRAEGSALPRPARRRPAGPRRPPAPPENRGNLALGGRHRRRLDADHHAAARPLTNSKPSLQPRKEQLTGGPWNPRHPARTPGCCHTPNIECGRSRNSPGLSG